MENLNYFLNDGNFNCIAKQEYKKMIFCETNGIINFDLIDIKIKNIISNDNVFVTNFPFFKFKGNNYSINNSGSISEIEEELRNGNIIIIYEINHKLDRIRYFKLKEIKNESEYNKVSRFKVVFPKTIDLNEMFIVEISKPHLKFNYVTKTYNWENIIIRFLDPINPSTTERLYNFYYDFIKKHPKEEDKPMFYFKIISLDSLGVEYEIWLINVENVINIDFGHLNNNQEDIKTINMIIKPLDCKILPYFRIS